MKKKDKIIVFNNLGGDTETQMRMGKALQEVTDCVIIQLNGVNPELPPMQIFSIKKAKEIKPKEIKIITDYIKSLK